MHSGKRAILHKPHIASLQIAMRGCTISNLFFQYVCTKLEAFETTHVSYNKEGDAETGQLDLLESNLDLSIGEFGRSTALVCDGISNFGTKGTGWNHNSQLLDDTVSTSVGMVGDRSIQAHIQWKLFRCSSFRVAFL